MKVYLSGAIENAPDGGKAWREDMAKWLKKNLDHDVFNPVEVHKSFLTSEEIANFRQWRLTDYPRFKEVVRKFIHRDIETITHDVDYVICYWDRAVLEGGGTHGELMMAYHNGIPVYTVLGMPMEKVSSWILGCSTEEFESFAQLKVFLEDEYGG